MSDFSKLLQIRNRKLDVQRRAERRMADLCAYCRQEVEKARQAMEDYMEEIKTLEIDLLTELVNTELKPADFKKIEARLKEAEEKAASLSQAHTEATEQLSFAEEKMTQERRTTTLMQSKTNKVAEIDRIERDAALTRQSNAEEAAIDEFVETMWARGGGR